MDKFINKFSYKLINFTGFVFLVLELIAAPYILARMTEFLINGFGYSINLTYLYIGWLATICIYMSSKSLMWLGFLIERFQMIGIDITKIPDVPVEDWKNNGELTIDMIKNGDFKKGN